MPTPAATRLTPRKTPVQARSTASVDALLEATAQVLLAVGKERLTTARVARRAGVSVGTLYQYFPNKSSLLQATLRRHLEGVESALRDVCHQQRGCPLAPTAAALAHAILHSKLGDRTAGVALYAVASDVDGAPIAREVADRIHTDLTDLLRSTPHPLTKDPALVATILQSAMAGISRRLLESPSPETQLTPLREELTTLLQAYLQTCV